MRVIHSVMIYDPSGEIGSNISKPLEEQVSKILNEKKAVDLDKITFLNVRPYQYLMVFYSND